MRSEPGFDDYQAATGLFDQLVSAEPMSEFLTVFCYDYLD